MSEVACYLHNLPNGDVTSQYLMNVPTQNVCDTMGKHQPMLLLNFMFFAVWQQSASGISAHTDVLLLSFC